MANISKAERHNRNMDKIFSTYREQQNKLPPAGMYINFIEMAEQKLNISKDAAREKYGLYTIQQWESLLNLGWNKQN